MNLFLKLRGFAVDIYRHFDTPPAKILLENYRFYMLANLAQTVAWITHLIWMILFLMLHVYTLAMIQIASVLVYIVAINLNRNAWHLTSMVISIFELLTHQIIASRMLGWNTGFQYFVIAIAIFPFLIPGGIQAIKWILWISCTLAYFYIEYSSSSLLPIYKIDPLVAGTFKVTNITLAFGLIAAWGLYFRLSVDRSKAIIESQTKELVRAEQEVERSEMKRELEVKALDNEIFHLRNIELKKSLDDLKAAQAQLIQQEKMVSLGQLTAGVAHEINNPVNFISGNINPLRRDFADLIHLLKKYDSKLSGDEEMDKLKKELDVEYTLKEIEELISGIESGASRTAAIVSGLSNFSRLNENQKKSADLNEGLKSTIMMIKSSLGERIQLHTEFGDLPEIVCFPGQMNQVFLNILNNAIQAIEGKGEIRIRTSFSDKEIRISIGDNGTGIKEEIRNRIFEPFFTTRDVGKGTGLGLSISFGIIESHHGRIDMTSEVGKGTEFVISLPASLSAL